jgi:hypothetical protein
MYGVIIGNEQLKVDKILEEERVRKMKNGTNNGKVTSLFTQELDVAYA